LPWQAHQHAGGTLYPNETIVAAIAVPNAAAAI